MAECFEERPRSASKQVRLMIVMAFVIGICLVGVTLSDGADAADWDEFTIEGIEYQVVSETDGIVKIIDYTGSATELTIPDKVTNGSVEYSVTSIGDDAFEGCKTLTSVIIGDIVETIGDYAFYECSSLTSVTIGKSVTSIGDDAFRDCFAIAGFYVSKVNPKYMDDGGILFSNDKTRLIQYPCARVGQYEIPATVTSIGPTAFENCSTLTSVTIPDSVTSIGNYAFEGCSSLTSVTIPDSVTTIGDDAFCRCISLITVTMGDAVETIGDYAFEGCSSLTSVTIPNSVTSIGKGAFYGCIFLTSVTIPNSVTSIGKGAFSECLSITGFDVAKDNPNYSDIDGVLFNKEGTHLIQYSCGKVGYYEVPATVTSIGPYAFEYCSTLTSVTIPNSVTSIGDDAFYMCTSLTSVTMGNAVETIGDYVFYMCTSLTSLTIPNGVTSIGDYAFYKCISLTSVAIPDSVISIGEAAFYGCIAITGFDVGEDNPNYTDIDGVLFNKGGTMLIKYPGGKEGAYTIPKEVTDIDDYAFRNCVKLTSIEVEAGNTEYSSVSGALFNKDGTKLIKCPGGKEGAYTIPKEVTDIDDYAFHNCVKLTSIEVEAGNTEYSSVLGVLFNKDGTALIKYPGGKEGAYTIPERVTHIDYYAFSYCNGLTSLTVNWSDQYDTDDIFDKGCYNLTEIIILGSDDLHSIDGAVYSVVGDGYSLVRCPEGKTSLVLPESTKSIGYDAVYDCPNLKEIVIKGGDSLSVHLYAFDYSNPDLVIKSGREGYDLKAYLDEAKTIEMTGDMLDFGWGGTLYFEWIPISDDPSDGINIGIMIGSIVAVIAMIALSTLLVLFRRKG